MSDIDISDWSYEDIIEHQQAKIDKLQKVANQLNKKMMGFVVIDGEAIDAQYYYSQVINGERELSNDS